MILRPDSTPRIVEMTVTSSPNSFAERGQRCGAALLDRSRAGHHIDQFFCDPGSNVGNGFGDAGGAVDQDAGMPPRRG